MLPTKSLLFALALGVALPALVLAQDDDGEKKPAKRELDTESPEAQALAELLNIDPKYGKDKRVELRYSFGEPVELDDFELRGFDRAETDYDLELGVGSRSQGLILHNLSMKGSFEVELRCRIDWIAPSSQLVFLFGDGKSGAIYGNVFAKRGSRGYKPVSKKAVPLRDIYNGGRDVALRYVIKDGVITGWVDGREIGSSKKLKKLDGRVGIYLTNMRLRVSSFTIKGEIDTSKL